MPRSHARAREKAGSPEGRPPGVFRQGEAWARVGLYARVSTHDQQTLPLQLSAMREHAQRRGWAVVMTVEDIGSGVSDRPRRVRFANSSEATTLSVQFCPFRGVTPIY